MPSVSDDGRLVAFVSFANNLVTNDSLSPFLDVLARDLVTSNTWLVSVNSSGVGGGNQNSGAPSISANGQFVAPTVAGATAAAAQKTTVSATNFSIVNEPGDATYPITGFSWVILRTSYRPYMPYRRNCGRSTWLPTLIRGLLGIRAARIQR